MYYQIYLLLYSFRVPFAKSSPSSDSVGVKTDRSVVR